MFYHNFEYVLKFLNFLDLQNFVNDAITQVFLLRREMIATCKYLGCLCKTTTTNY